MSQFLNKTGLTKLWSKIKNSFNSAFRYSTDKEVETGYYKIKIKSTSGWMMSFKIHLYQRYTYDEIVISGYNYGTNHWFRPAASLVTSQGSFPKDNIDIIFGYDSDWNLWIAIPRDRRTGILITDVVNGNNNAISDVNSLFEIVEENTLTGTTQTTITATRLAKLTDTVANADTVDGKHANQFTPGTTTIKKSLSAAGWYRVYTSATVNNYGESILLGINRAWVTTNNENYLFAITVGHGGKINITQLSGAVNTKIITAIRVVWKNNSYWYVDMFYNSTSANEVIIQGVGPGTFTEPIAGATIPDGFSFKNFDTVEGFKCDKITAPEATKTTAGLMSKEDKNKLDNILSIPPKGGIIDFGDDIPDLVGNDAEALDLLLENYELGTIKFKVRNSLFTIISKFE